MKRREYFKRRKMETYMGTYMGEIQKVDAKSRDLARDDTKNVKGGRRKRMVDERNKKIKVNIKGYNLSLI